MHIELTEEDINWCKKHTNIEIAEKFNRGSAWVIRIKKKHNIQNVRKKGSGKCRTGIISNCKNPNCTNEVYLTKKDADKGRYCSRSCKCNDPSFREKLKNIDRSYMQTEQYKNSLRKETTPEYKRYVNAVHKLSNKTYEKNIDKLNPKNYKRTLAGIEDGYQLDHILPINEGFKQGLSIEKMSELDNLRLISWEDNLKRNKKNFNE